MTIHHKTQVPWPANRLLTSNRKSGPFTTNMSDACARIEKEVGAFTKPGRSWRTVELWIYADGKLGAKNRFSAKQPGLKDPRVAVAFDIDGKQYSICTDRYIEPWQNLCGIAEYIKAIRAQERNGILTVEEMFASFAALPTGGTWFDGLSTAEDIRKVYRALVQQHHPDKGGDAEEFTRITDTYNRALEEVNR